MNLLFVCKRSPQRRDLVARPYGRFHHLPRELAARGHRVTLLLVGHGRHAPARDLLDGMERIAVEVRGEGPLRAWRRLREEAKAARPDWVVGCSDAWAGWLAHRLARHCDARLAIDAYDDYESYMPWNLPLHALWRQAIGAAALATAAGPQLAQLLDQHRRGREATKVLPMAADPAFGRRERSACRARLSLPAEGRWLGYYGGWGEARGTDLLMRAFALLRERDPEAGLLLTGKPPADVARQPGVRCLGYLDDAQLPVFVSALDSAFVLTADTAFGRSSYPAKLCEAMACGRPVAATDTAPVRWMLGSSTRFLAPLDDAQALAGVAAEAAALGEWDYGALPSWQAGAADLDAWLRA